MGRFIGLSFAFVIGCTGARGPKGDPGDQGNGVVPDAGPVPDGGTPPTEVNCNPGISFCTSDQKLWTCTLSGHDATNTSDCTTAFGASATNPGSCITSDCANGGAACCALAHDRCTYSVTSPTALQGNDCSPPSSDVCVGFTILLSHSTKHMGSVCTIDGEFIEVTIDRTKHAPGSSFTPSTEVILETFGGGTVAFCSTWTGSVNWISDVPTWQVSLNLTCSSGTLNGQALVGTFSGQL